MGDEDDDPEDDGQSSLESLMIRLELMSGVIDEDCVTPDADVMIPTEPDVDDPSFNTSISPGDGDEGPDDSDPVVPKNPDSDDDDRDDGLFPGVADALPPLLSSGIHLMVYTNDGLDFLLSYSLLRYATISEL